MHDYLKKLNEAQREAVVNTKGASLVIAGAGSGKTRVLTYRIAHLLANGVPPYKILALTFTNKAAREMKQRIGEIVGFEHASNLWMGTFHSIFARILRYESAYLGYDSNYTIYDTSDSKNLIKSIIKEKKLDEKTYKPGQILGRISRAKNNLITPSTYQNNSTYYSTDEAHRVPYTGQIYAAYMKRCKISGAMDFDDLLLNTNILLRDHKAVLEKYQQRFDYILVDEYQDTNFAQYLILKKLAEKHHNICVVGDDSQSIYAFRGAKIENILNFQKDYPEMKVFKLEHNYRSTQNIVNAANSVIANNQKQLPKKVFTENDEGEKIGIVRAITEVEEGHLIANSIQEKRLNEQKKFSDFAILYRTNAQSRILEEALRKRNIPYRIYGGLSFYQRKEIKDLVGYLRMTINPNDDEALKRIINYPARGIGNTTMSKLESAATANGISIWQVLAAPQKYGVNINSGTTKKLQGFIILVQQFTELAANNDAYDAALQIASNSGLLKDLYNDKSPEGRSRYENIQELLNGIKDFVSNAHEEGTDVKLHTYIENIALLTDMDKNKDEDQERITLMTIHSAKGLEFQHLYIAGLEEGLFPSSMSMESPEEIEEERRLFYVALTRAEHTATLYWCQSRYKWGSVESKSPSRFLKELDQAYIDASSDDSYSFENPEPGQTHFSKPTSQPAFQNSSTRKSGTIKSRNMRQPMRSRPTANQGPAADPNFTPEPPENIKEGQTVIHQRFGRGEITRIEGEGTNRKASVQFASGRKTLLLRFAKLKVIKAS
ncbi:MAG TPA: UvrD-helicase domain-containing protein [Salinivirga sp.]|uniref:ATP-dependent helicase n=1 Tax=Salinivirga sp. TaxID=1970192 RepID=UPI002B459926|nr:UvrD-helicase domain-containing protein [Salinivirga sp.]HKK58720.1 UvrD-helicase domain-containing protein [Salinivirga sp.]